MADLRTREGHALRVAIVGGGVIGLSCALELRDAGHDVTVLARDELGDTTSARAGAVWFPFRAAPADRVLAWGARTFERFETLAADPATGVRMQRGRVLHRSPAPDLWWTVAVPSVTAIDDPAELPDGVLSASECTVPVIDMSYYLPWLQAQCDARGVQTHRTEISELDEAFEHGDLVVLAAGLASTDFASDADVVPVRGQTVRLKNPGYFEWTLDYANPDGLTYVIPRLDEIVCGGTDEEGEWGLDLDPAVEAGVLERVRALIPELREAPITSRAVGLRPGRREVRVETIPDAQGRPVIHCYGHGGSGVTLSWGCAEAVAALTAQL